MEKFEYKEVAVLIGNPQDHPDRQFIPQPLLFYLNQFGRDGWQVIQIQDLEESSANSLERKKVLLMRKIKPFYGNNEST